MFVRGASLENSTQGIQSTSHKRLPHAGVTAFAMTHGRVFIVVCSLFIDASQVHDRYYQQRVALLALIAGYNSQRSSLIYSISEKPLSS